MSFDPNQITLMHQSNFNIYRPAGYRHPNERDEYVSKDGKIKLAQANAIYDGPRLIVRRV